MDIDINMKKKIRKYIKINNYDGYFIDQEVNLLSVAIEKTNVEITQILLTRQDIDINSLLKIEEFNEDDFTYKKETNEAILHCAIKQENIDILKFLLSRNDIDINIKLSCDGSHYKEEKTALIMAIKRNNFQMVELLLQHPKIDINTKLIFISEYNDDDDDECYDDYDDFTNLKYVETPALNLAVRKENLRIVQLLLSKNDIDVNSKNISIIYEKDINDDFNIETERLEYTALNNAILNKNIEIIKLLLSRNDIDVNSLQIRYFSSDNNENENIWDELTIETALSVAVKNNLPEIVELLLSKSDIDVNIMLLYKHTDYKEDNIEPLTCYLTALHYAVFAENIEIIKILLKNKNLNINIEIGNGKKPIDLTNNEKIKELFKNYNS